MQSENILWQCFASHMKVALINTCTKSKVTYEDWWFDRIIFTSMVVHSRAVQLKANPVLLRTSVSVGWAGWKLCNHLFQNNKKMTELLRQKYMYSCEKQPPHAAFCLRHQGSAWLILGLLCTKHVGNTWKQCDLCASTLVPDCLQIILRLFLSLACNPDWLNNL